jgi:4a-hydroxytetrahydrobiopterin dehydratase
LDVIKDRKNLKLIEKENPNNNAYKFYRVNLIIQKQEEIIMKIFAEQETWEYLSKNLKSWTFEKGVIKREFEFKNFVEAFSFMTAIALEAEKLDHHPDWSNTYNKVRIALSTHSANGITQMDLDLAGKIDIIYNKNGKL